MDLVRFQIKVHRPHDVKRLSVTAAKIIDHERRYPGSVVMVGKGLSQHSCVR